MFKYVTEESGYAYDDSGYEYEYHNVTKRNAEYLGTVNGADLYLFQYRGEVTNKIIKTLQSKGREFEVYPLNYKGQLLAIKNSRREDHLAIDPRFRFTEVHYQHPAYGSEESYRFYPGTYDRMEAARMADELTGTRTSAYDTVYSVETLTPYGVMLEKYTPYDD